MYGNAPEWVYDWYGQDYYDGAPKTDPSGPLWGNYRIQRGGSYETGAEYVSSSLKTSFPPDYDGSVYGEDWGMRLLKGEPLDLPTATPFPQDSSGPFLPVHEGNIWIMAVSAPWDSPNVDFSAYVLERGEVIDGKQYWDWEGHRALPMFWSPFRVDEKGVWELIQDRWTSDAVNELLIWLDENPELRESQYYQESSFLKSLKPDQKELLLYDFYGAAFDFGNSSTPELDYALMDQQRVVFEIERYVDGSKGRAPNQLSFSWWGTEQTGEIVFQRGVGPVSLIFSDPHGWSPPIGEELVWARIDGKEYGLHPGPDYPGYRPIKTVVASPELAAPHPVSSGLSPNFPNPFNSLTQIPYRLAAPGRVRLEIYSVLGQLVRTLVDEDQAAGFHRADWDARDRQGARMASGVYLARLQHPAGVETRRLLYLE